VDVAGAGESVCETPSRSRNSFIRSPKARFSGRSGLFSGAFAIAGERGDSRPRGPEQIGIGSAALASTRVSARRGGRSPRRRSARRAGGLTSSTLPTTGQFPRPVDDKVQELCLDRRLTIRAARRAAMLIFWDSDVQHLVEPLIDSGVLAIVWADDENCYFVLSRKENQHAPVVPQLDRADVLDAFPRKPVVGSGTSKPRQSGTGIFRRSGVGTSERCQIGACQRGRPDIEAGATSPAATRPACLASPGRGTRGSASSPGAHPTRAC